MKDIKNKIYFWIGIFNLLEWIFILVMSFWNSLPNDIVFVGISSLIVGIYLTGGFKQ